MKFNKMKRMIKNPDAVKKYFQTGNKDEAR